MEKLLLESTTQSRKQKIKNDDDFFEFYKTGEDDEDIEYGAILSSNFVSHLVSLKKRKPRAPNRVRNKEWWKNCYRRWKRLQKGFASYKSNI